MVRNVDENKAYKIREVLKNSPNGLWVREIARKTGLDKSTVSIYLSKHMKNEVKSFSISNLVKIYKLRGKNERVN